MSCQKISTSDLEDIIKTRDDKFDKVNNNITTYKEIVEKLLNFYKENNNKKNFKKLFNQYFGKLGRRKDIILKKIYVVYVYKSMINNNEIENINNFWHYIQLKSSRNMSGVNSFAILLPPFPVNDDFNGCNHDCYYCPNQTKANGADVDIARSYLLKEPAVQRGFRNGWNAIDQMVDRMNSLLVQGLEVDKLELIIEGGTYTEYPMTFLERFHRDIFYSANTFFDINKREQLSIKEEIKINMTSSVRIIGICIETRPDAINDEWIRFFRHTGTTRIQLGVQHTNNKILKKINRGHTFEQSCEAIKLLKNNCFKIDIHLMPDLPLSSPEEDKKMFDIVFKTSIITPDQVKIYPCEVTPYTTIKKWYDTGKYIPYTDKEPKKLFNVVLHALMICPPWVRMPRIVRDIPLLYIEGGNKYCNLRQMIQDKIEKDNIRINEIRSREIGRNTQYKFKNSLYRIRKYIGSGSTEYFISLESWDTRALYGFIRLRIPPKYNKPIFKCLINKGLIRELHVYNWVVCVGNDGNKNSTQHRGVGKTLLKIAEWIAWFHGLEGTAVITGEGVREYYHKQNYHSEDSFAIKKYNMNIYYIFRVVFAFLLLGYAFQLQSS
tara:strand:+ start:837 stop:2654 length:1818 start_codon:yes stop_codon:yes gene_type:complete